MLHLRRLSLPGEGAMREGHKMTRGIQNWFPQLHKICSTVLPLVRKSLPENCQTSLDNWAAFLEFLWTSWVIGWKSVHPFCLKSFKCLNPLEIHTSSHLHIAQWQHQPPEAREFRHEDEPQNLRHCANKGSGFHPSAPHSFWSRKNPKS